MTKDVFHLSGPDGTDMELPVRKAQKLRSTDTRAY